MDLLEKKFREVMVDDRISKYRVRVRAIGDLNRLPKRVRAAIKEAERTTQGHDGHTLNIVVGYWSKGELAAAMRKVCE